MKNTILHPKGREIKKKESLPWVDSEDAMIRRLRFFGGRAIAKRDADNLTQGAAAILNMSTPSMAINPQLIDKSSQLLRDIRPYNYGVEGMQQFLIEKAASLFLLKQKLSGIFLYSKA